MTPKSRVLGACAPAPVPAWPSRPRGSVSRGCPRSLPGRGLQGGPCVLAGGRLRGEMAATQLLRTEDISFTLDRPPGALRRHSTQHLIRPVTVFPRHLGGGAGGCFPAVQREPPGCCYCSAVFLSISLVTPSGFPGGCLSVDSSSFHGAQRATFHSPPERVNTCSRTGLRSSGRPAGQGSQPRHCRGDGGRRGSWCWQQWNQGGLPAAADRLAVRPGVRLPPRGAGSLHSVLPRAPQPPRPLTFRHIASPSCRVAAGGLRRTRVTRSEASSPHAASGTRSRVPRAPVGDTSCCTEGFWARVRGPAVTSSDNSQGGDGGCCGPGQTCPR